MKRVKLIESAPQWHRLWSIRFILLATAFGALEMSLPLWQGVIPDLHFAALSTACTLLAGISRVIKQEFERGADQAADQVVSQDASSDASQENTDDPHPHN